MKAAAPLLLALAGCAAAAGLSDPPLGQLARWRDAPRASLAAEPVVSPCPVANPACPKLHALRAEACLGEALAARAPGAACPASRAVPLLDCAAEGYAAALAADATGAPALRAGQAQALLCRAELDDPATASSRARAASEAAAGAPPELAALHGARAALLLARTGADLSERRMSACAGTGSSRHVASAKAGTQGPETPPTGNVGSRVRGNDSGDGSAPAETGLASTAEHLSESRTAGGRAGHSSGSRAAAAHAARDLSELCKPAAPDLSERCRLARRALDLSASAPAENRARLRADALLHLRSCEAPDR